MPVKENDLRYKSIHTRLILLSSDEIQRILDNIDNLCLDTYNYDQKTGKFCPLAIAFGVEDIIREMNVKPTQELTLSILKCKAGEAWGTVKGVSGEFYKNNRKADLEELCKEILIERNHRQVR